MTVTGKMKKYLMRAKMADAVVVLGSATPSLESYFNAKKNKYALLELPDRTIPKLTDRRSWQCGRSPD